jgi:hypothetical protein
MNSLRKPLGASCADAVIETSSSSLESEGRGFENVAALWCNFARASSLYKSRWMSPPCSFSEDSCSGSDRLETDFEAPSKSAVYPGGKCAATTLDSLLSCSWGVEVPEFAMVRIVGEMISQIRTSFYFGWLECSSCRKTSAQVNPLLVNNSLPGKGSQFIFDVLWMRGSSDLRETLRPCFFEARGTSLA